MNGLAHRVAIIAALGMAAVSGTASAQSPTPPADAVAAVPDPEEPRSATLEEGFRAADGFAAAVLEAIALARAELAELDLRRGEIEAEIADAVARAELAQVALFDLEDRAKTAEETRAAAEAGLADVQKRLEGVEARLSERTEALAALEERETAARATLSEVESRIAACEEEWRLADESARADLEAEAAAIFASAEATRDTLAAEADDLAARFEAGVAEETRLATRLAELEHIRINPAHIRSL
jgi:chromosome segregation ATPase